MENIDILQPPFFLQYRFLHLTLAKALPKPHNEKEKEKKQKCKFPTTKDKYDLH